MCIYLNTRFLEAYPRGGVFSNRVWLSSSLLETQNSSQVVLPSQPPLGPDERSCCVPSLPTFDGWYDMIAKPLYLCVCCFWGFMCYFPDDWCNWACCHINIGLWIAFLWYVHWSLLVHLLIGPSGFLADLQKSFVKYLFPQPGLSFHYFYGMLWWIEFLILMCYIQQSFLFMIRAYCILFKKSFPTPKSGRYSPAAPSRNFCFPIWVFMFPTSGDHGLRHPPDGLPSPGENNHKSWMHYQKQEANTWGN